jgi:hypothetical protein
MKKNDFKVFVIYTLCVFVAFIAVLVWTCVHLYELGGVVLAITGTVLSVVFSFAMLYVLYKMATLRK